MFSRQSIRYIEIFRSSLSEVRASIGPKMRGGPMSGLNQRPASYDQRDRFGGMNRFSNNGRNARNKDFDGGLWGGGGGGVGGGGGGGNNFSSRGSGMEMRGDGMDMEGGGNFRESGDYWNRGGRIYMLGLPYKATVEDIADFFSPFVPINIRILRDKYGRPYGRAHVKFETHEEAVKAMSKDKNNMSHRYIQLFLKSSSWPSGGDGGSGDKSIENFPGTNVADSKYK